MKYSAFLSYSHGDEPTARWLHRRLEAFRIPKRIVEKVAFDGAAGNRLLPVFRDADELASSPDLAKVLNEALDSSAALVVLCSPRSRKSQWVNEEIRRYAKIGGIDRIHCVLVEGDPTSQDPAEHCFPPALAEVGLAEPLAIDLRPGSEPRPVAMIRLIAGLLGLPFDELRQREAARRQKRLMIVASTLAVGIVLTSALAAYAWFARNRAIAAEQEAVEQRDVAIRRTETAERTVAFVKDLFFTSDPSEALGREITARQILDQGREKLLNDLASEPAVRVELATTLAEVHNALGLYDQAADILAWSFGLANPDRVTAIRQVTVAAETQRFRGDLDVALTFARRAAAAVGQGGDIPPDTAARARTALAEVLLERGENDAAEPILTALLEEETKRLGGDHPHVALLLEGLGNIKLARDNLAGAQALFARALDIRRRREGETSPSVSDNVLMLGQIAWRRRDGREAERLYRSRLEIDERVLGATHPSVGLLLVDLGFFIAAHRRGLEEARSMLERAYRILTAQGETTNDLTQLRFNLGVVYNGLGRHREARAELEQALRDARATGAPLASLIAIELGHARCRSGAAASARPLLDQARREVREAYPAQAWYGAWADGAAGECLLRLGDRVQAARLIQQSAPAILDRWPVGAHYRAETERRLELVN